MGRPLSFERATALDAAMGQFWRHGFHGTSTEELCRVTGLRRSSLYNSFGTKEQVFAECLRLYLERSSALYAEVMGRAGESVAARVAALLDAVVAEEVQRRQDGAPSGCLAVNTVVELSSDPEHHDAARTVTRDTEKRLQVLTQYLRAGQASGEIAKDIRANDLAAYLNAVIVGLRVAARSGAEVNGLRGIARAALRAVEPAVD